MAVRSFQQILDAHESAQDMLRSLEVDVRDTLNQARVELARYQVAPVSSAIASTEWEVGDRFELVFPKPAACRLFPRGVSFGVVYTLIPKMSLDVPGYALSFIDDNGHERVFYSFWRELIRKV